MCNKYRNRFPKERYTDTFNQLKLPFRFGEFTPNFREGDYTITDICPVIRLAGDTFELTGMRWSWPGPAGRPVFNFRSEGRHFALEDRVLLPADGYYEFTRDKERFLFQTGMLFWLAGYARDGAFSMLTTRRSTDWPKEREPVSFEYDDGPQWLLGKKDIEPAPIGRFNILQA